LTKEEYMERCSTAYDVGLVSSEVLTLLKDWTNFVMRLEGGHIDSVAMFLASEKARTDHFIHTMHSDRVGLRGITLLNLLAHPCQTCATDPFAWWTQNGKCTHKERYDDDAKPEIRHHPV